MSTGGARRGDRLGGASAWAMAALSLAMVAVTITSVMRAARDALPAAEVARRLALTTAPLLAIGAFALLLVARSTARLQRPPSWVTRLGLAGAVGGAAVNLAAAAVLVRVGWTGGDVQLGRILVELTPVGAGVWALCASAADWRMRLWPAWLRVAGALFGAGAMVQPGMPPAALLALLAGLVWWIGLGVQLFRGPRSTGG